MFLACMFLHIWKKKPQSSKGSREKKLVYFFYVMNNLSLLFRFVVLELVKQTNETQDEGTFRANVDMHCSNTIQELVEEGLLESCESLQLTDVGMCALFFVLFM